MAASGNSNNQIEVMYYIHKELRLAREYPRLSDVRKTREPVCLPNAF
jgi:hypothetical protein